MLWLLLAVHPLSFEGHNKRERSWIKREKAEKVRNFKASSHGGSCSVKRYQDLRERIGRFVPDACWCPDRHQPGTQEHLESAVVLFS